MSGPAGRGRLSSSLAARLDRRASTSGVGPADIDVAEVHDASAYAEIQQIENLGFCASGEGGPFTEAGATALGGAIPVNTSGGLVSKGHPIGATGLRMLYEGYTQLLGRAGKRQLPDPKLCLTHNLGGFPHQNVVSVAIVGMRGA